MRLKFAAGAFLLCCASVGVAAQSVVAGAEATFYGDNTEFANPFRKGETIFGAYSRLFVEARFGDRAALRAGVFANQRFGGDSSFELVRPVLSLSVGTRQNRFIFGTLDTIQPSDTFGPDRGSLHGLLPPLEVETLSFTRPQEAGLQWLVDTRRLRQDTWINWQRLNTKEHREVFDAGLTNRLWLRGPFFLATQFHIVHHGGQLFSNGAVSDSAAYGPGLVVSGPWGHYDLVTAELYGVVSHYTPDRALGRRINGAGFLARLSAERNGWRGHALMWRARDVLKEEGDPNYLAFRRNGTRFRPIRDYAEVGLSRLFRPDPHVRLEASARFHRTEYFYEYSYRVLAHVNIEVPIR